MKREVTIWVYNYSESVYHLSLNLWGETLLIFMGHDTRVLSSYTRTDMKNFTKLKIRRI